MDLELFITTIYNDSIKFYHSGFFALIKFLLGIYATILLVDIILLLVNIGLKGSLRETLTGMDIPRELTTKKRKARKTWHRIKRKLESANESDYKVAIIEADAFIDNLIERLGYAGDNFGERLAGIPDSQIVNIEGMKQAHEIRNHIIHDEKFAVSRKDAEIVLDHFEEFLRSYQVID